MYIVESIAAVMSKKEQEEEEEALSLCDLPVVETAKDENESSDQSRVLEELEEEEDDFEFGSWGNNSLLRESYMCAAEDVFFEGQILPLRLSVSCSDGGIAGIGQDSQNPSSSSSRSCSIRSRNSNSSSSSGSSVFFATSTTTITGRGVGYRDRDLSQNHFHAHSSPRPQIRQTPAPPGNGGGRNRRSTVWGIFRPGLVRTPEMDLHDLKLNRLRNRNNTSQKSRNSKDETKEQVTTKLMKTTTTSTQRKVRMFEGLTSGCKSSVETIPSRIAIIPKKVSGSDQRVGEKNELDDEEQQQRRQEQHKHGKQAMAHRRTFEWLKQLSLADLQQQEA